jgi:hypothetical protein
MALPTAPLAATGLIGGYAAARATGNRPLGGLALGAVGVVCARQWLRATGPGVTAGLLAVYVGGMGVSHPLAKRIGAWPSVLTTATIAAGAAWAASDRRAA